MIEDALTPSEAEDGIFTAREDGGIFNRDAALVIVAIQSPRLKLAARQLAFVHEQVKWMLVMVALFADRIKAGEELGFREQRHFCRCV